MGHRAGTQRVATIIQLSSLWTPAGLSSTQLFAHGAQYKVWPMTGVYYSELNCRDKTFADFLPASIWEFKCISHSLSLTINLFRRKNMYAFLQRVTGIKSIVYSYPANGAHRTCLFSPPQPTPAHMAPSPGATAVGGEQIMCIWEMLPTLAHFWCPRGW